jgi:cell division protein FtsI (penicillin-binding protein 3)
MCSNAQVAMRSPARRVETFKVITVASALNEGIITPTQEFFCEEGRFQVADRVIRDSRPHGKLEVGQVIQKSSNICAAKIGMEMTPAQFHDYITKFGFGAKTRAGLTGEATGQLLPPEKWTRVDHANLSYGQGILVSPLQVVAAINASGSLSSNRSLRPDSMGPSFTSASAT